MLRHLLAIVKFSLEENILTDVIVFDYIPSPVFTHTTGMTQFKVAGIYKWQVRDKYTSRGNYKLPSRGQVIDRLLLSSNSDEDKAQNLTLRTS